MDSTWVNKTKADVDGKRSSNAPPATITPNILVKCPHISTRYCCLQREI